jgi:lauroyl/myristoyl acyltransferase
LRATARRGIWWFARRWPRLAYRVAWAAARISQPLGRGVPEEQIAAAFPALAPPSLRAARRRAWSNLLLGRALHAASTRPGRRPLHPEMVITPAARELTAPLILVFAHIGPYQALGWLLERLDGNVLALVERGGFAPRPGMTLVTTGEDEWTGARALARAVSELKAGAFVFLAIDGQEAATLEAPALGGTVRLARGPFALARITATPIVPLVARWRGLAIEIAVGDTVQPSSDEQSMAAEAAAWLDRYLRSFPGELSPHLLKALSLPPAR